MHMRVSVYVGSCKYVCLYIYMYTLILPTKVRHGVAGTGRGSHLDLLRSPRFQWDPWAHLDSLALTWTRLDPLALTWTHLESLGLTCAQMD